MALDVRALDGGGATGVGRYIRALMEAMQARPDTELEVFQGASPPILGPQLITPLQMRRGQAQLIHGPANSLPLYLAGLPGVVTVHDLAIYDHPEWFPRGQWFATRVVVPQSIRRARAIICPSAATRAAVVRLFRVAPERCQVIPHGVEPAFADPVGAAQRKSVRARYGLPARYLIQVGTIQPRKNYLASLRALARIPATERLPLVVVGNFGWDYGDVVETVGRLNLNDWVRFVGYAGLDDLPALYQMAAAALFPSLDEGFGIPVLEAMAAGVPLVASNAGAIPEAAGEAALLCDPHDDETLARNLSRILSDAALRQNLIAAGRRRAAGFTWAASAEAHRRVYASVI